jgi:hypothetical protein
MFGVLFSPTGIGGDCSGLAKIMPGVLIPSFISAVLFMHDEACRIPGKVRLRNSSHRETPRDPILHLPKADRV